MSYDFYLFEPDRDDHGNITPYDRMLSQNPGLLKRLNPESGTATAQLEQIAARINAQITAKEQLGIYYEEAETDRDRAVVIPVSYDSKDQMLHLLVDVATRHNLGLAASNDFVWCYGDEDPKYFIETPWWKLNVAGPVGIEPSLDWLRTSMVNDRYLIVGSKTEDECYLQFMYAAEFAAHKTQALENATAEMPDWVTEPTPADALWRVEYRDGDRYHHYGMYINKTQQVCELAMQWFAQKPELKQHDWQKMEM